MYVNSLQIKAARGNATRFNLMPFGDLQVGSPVFLRSKWDEYVADVKATENVITIGMGDYTDHFRPTVQGRLYNALGKDDSVKTFDEMHRKHIKRDVYSLIKPVVENSVCLGLLGGHHDLTYANGTTSTQYLCELLGVPYLGDGEALLRVNLKLYTAGLSFTIYATHGQGTGNAVGSSIAKQQKLLAHFDADIFLRGHSCDRYVFQEPKYFLTHTIPPKLRQRNLLIANTGSFSDGRAEGETTYVEKANLIPKAVGYVRLPINVRRDEAGVKYLVMGD